MRLIDADALLNDISDLKKSPWFHENYFDHKNIRKEAIEIVEQLCIDKAPTIDAVPVIRCRDCRWWDKEREQCGIAPSASPYGHCHDGETLEHSMIKDTGR